MKEEITCPSCHARFAFASNAEELRAHYCPFCRSALSPGKEATVPVNDNRESQHFSASISFFPENIPTEQSVQFSIGHYQIIHSIGKGGMGEVFLAYDTVCGRRLALKKIRADLKEHCQLERRFLKEARITSQLTHPAIIPIYSIHHEENLTFYTMPYVEGKTLKQILRAARENKPLQKEIEHLNGSIPALTRVFLGICQAIAYAHSKNVLHRDIKPENIIVGQYGQIVILDWGLAKIIKDNPEKVTEDEEESHESSIHPMEHLTNIGKVVGTVSYMAPERGRGNPANFQTDIYSLGVILYQVLTLRLPFQRESLKHFKQNMHLEKLVDPAEVAPYRDVPRSLARVVMKCLATDPKDRYRSVDELIHDLENYIEGRSEWFPIAELDINNKADWEFQENVLIAEHVALTRGAEVSDWVSLMISKVSFQGNTKLEAMVRIGERGHGIGFLLCVPEAAERKHLNDGYCLWLGTSTSKTTKLLRSTVEVMHTPDIFLHHNEWYKIRIEKIENNIHIYINDVLQHSYISHLPLPGTHIGLLSRDADFVLKDFTVYTATQNVTVNCLAVPDAFLAHKDYVTALNEYRRIGYSFPGRAEGREAMFRAGIALLEQANNTADQKEKAELYDAAQEEFHKLYGTPGAPLEYLGKALVYRAQGDYEEEIKCFELALRRYPNHPLLSVLQEQIVYRMYDSSRYSRKATFNFLLLTIRHLPSASTNSNTVKLLKSLERHWEPLLFIENDPDTSLQAKNFDYSLKIAFWLAKPFVIEELIDEMLEPGRLNPIAMGNALFCLIEIGSWHLAAKKLHDLLKQHTKKELEDLGLYTQYLEVAIKAYESLEEAIKAFVDLPNPQKLLFFQQERVLLFLVEKAIDQRNIGLVHQLLTYAKSLVLSEPTDNLIEIYTIWCLMLEKKWAEVGEHFHQYPIETLSQEKDLLYFLYGCWLYFSEGNAIAVIHFSGGLEVTYPRTWTLFGYYLKGKIAENQGWLQKAFLWEKRQLFRQLALFYYCADNIEKADEYRRKIIETQLIDAS